MLEDTHDEGGHDDGESKPDGVMRQEILVIHLALNGILAALDGFRIREDRAFCGGISATDELLSPGNALQDADDLVERKFVVPAFGVARTSEKDAEEYCVAYEQMDGDGDGHDIVESGVDCGQKIILDVCSGVSGKFLFVQYDFHVFVRVNDDIAVDDQRAFQGTVVFDTDIVSNKDCVFRGRLTFVVFVESATSHNDRRAAKDDIVL